MKSDIETGREALGASRDKLATDLVAAAGQATDLAKNIAGRQLESAQEALSSARSAVTDEARHAAGVAHNYVRANPWQALAVAAGAGLVLGLLLARR